ncbi:DNA-binding response regulator, partial [Xanthomonas citri pv. citri]|nr:DNA-binding response regulator [Xanthomonas citri pv. citri]
MRKSPLPGRPGNLLMRLLVIEDNRNMVANLFEYFE